MRAASWRLEIEEGYGIVALFERSANTFRLAGTAQKVVRPLTTGQPTLSRRIVEPGLNARPVFGLQRLRWGGLLAVTLVSARASSRRANDIAPARGGSVIRITEPPVEAPWRACFYRLKVRLAGRLVRPDLSRAFSVTV